jgi:pimeloyl-ACP methyl ester carboxylesterase
MRMGAVVPAVLLALSTSFAAGAAPASATDTPAIRWGPCAKDAAAQCGTLSLPVDWAHPHGPRFDLAVARRLATDPAARVGSMVFGPGGPGDSGVDRIVTGPGRFSAELRRRFDIVSFDPRGVGRSSPAVCSPDLLAQRPAPILTSQADFDATLAFNRRLRQDCRRRTGPVFDHSDTLSTVRDLDALRAALGERTLTFHGSSYGTLLGEQYAAAYPDRVRAIVLESVVDHSLGTRAFLDTQAVSTQDSFDEFMTWCGRTPACALYGRDVRAVWTDLLARAARGELRTPADPPAVVTPFDLSATAFRDLYNPNWADLADTLAAFDAGRPAEVSGLPPVATSVFCQDWAFPVRNYREYADLLNHSARLAPDTGYPVAAFAISMCLGTPGPINNPQRELTAHNRQPVLLVSTVHDPAAPRRWATNVARQLGRHGVLLTYEGWGHGAYNSTPCARQAVDDYLINGTLPAPGTRCPAVLPPGA